MNVPSIKKLFSRQRDAAREVTKNVESIRQEILRRQDEVARIKGMPAERGEALEALDSGLDLLAASGAETLGIGNLVQPAYKLPHLSLKVPESAILAVVTMVARDEIRQVMAEKIEQFYEGRDVMPRAKRGQRLEVLEAEALDLELAEEALIRESEHADMPVLRRADADPRAVLAADHALPQY